MQEDILQLLKQLLGPYKEKSKGNFAFKCPFCNHPKYKLEVHPESGKWHCWVCHEGGHNLMYLLKKVGADSYYFEELSILLPSSKYKFLHGQSQKEKSQKKIHRLPKEFTPLWEPKSSMYYTMARGYLESRGIRLSDIYKYHMGYATSGKYKNMIIIPNYKKNGLLNYFTTRSFISSFGKKFVNPPISRDVVGFELQLNWDEPLILLESALDAITLRRNTSPLYGTTLNDSVKAAIFINDVQHLTIALDPDAMQLAIKFSEYFSGHGLEINLVEFPEGTDPNSLGYEKAWDIINNRGMKNASDIFLKKIKSKLQ